MSSEPTVKKVKPFPFSASLTDARGTSSGQIHRLTLHGLMIELGATALQPGEKVDVSFVTPVLNGTVAISGVVVKVYNHLTRPTELARPAEPIPEAAPSESAFSSTHLVEVHLKGATGVAMSRIAQFLESIGQIQKRS